MTHTLTGYIDTEYTYKYTVEFFIRLNNNSMSISPKHKDHTAILYS